MIDANYGIRTVDVNTSSDIPQLQQNYNLFNDLNFINDGISIGVTFINLKIHECLSVNSCYLIITSHNFNHYFVRWDSGPNVTTLRAFSNYGSFVPQGPIDSFGSFLVISATNNLSESDNNALMIYRLPDIDSNIVVIDSNYQRTSTMKVVPY